MIDLSVNSKVIDNVDLVIFDKDGTLIELYTYWSQMVELRARNICETLGLREEHQAGLRWALGVDGKSLRLRPEGPVGLRKREIVLKAATDYLSKMGLRDTLRICERAFDRADEMSIGNLSQLIKPVPGAVSLLGELRAHGCRIALATVDVSRRARMAMEFMGVSDKFDLIVGGEEVARSKPDPEMIHVILDRLRVAPVRAVMVGDAITDVQMGISAGLKGCVGVLSGFAREDQLKTLTPFVARDVSAIGVRNPFPSSEGRE